MTFMIRKKHTNCLIGMQLSLRFEGLEDGFLVFPVREIMQNGTVSDCFSFFMNVMFFGGDLGFLDLTFLWLT